MEEQFNDIKRYKLNSESIDEISKYIKEFLTNTGASRREILKNQLAIECCLEIMAGTSGKENECTLRFESGLRRKFLILEFPGPMKNPLNPDIEKSKDNQEIQMIIDNTGLLSAIGFIPEYYYVNGKNVLRISSPILKERKSNSKIAFFVAICLLVVLIKNLFPTTAQIIFNYAINPIYSVFMRMLSLICGPLVLFSIITSICGMRNKATFSLTGSVVVRRFMVTNFILVTMASIFSVFFFEIELTGRAEFEFALQGIIQMIVEIVPSDIVSPFVNGNVIQIVFIGVILGFTVMLFSDSVTELSTIILQIQHVIMQVMHFLGMLMPYFVLTTILKLLLSRSFTQLAEIIKPIVLIWACYLLMIIIETIIVSISTKTNALKLLKNTFSASFIRLTTSSSTAAIDKMNENCIEKLGINSNVANFAIPLGQVIFKPAAALSLFICAMFAAQNAGITINPIFLLTNLIISYVIGISMAPVAGAMISCISILYLQLGIPQDYIALGVSISLLLDNIGTMTNVQLLQEEVFASQKSIDRKHNNK